VHQVGQLLRLYWDARSAKHQNLWSKRTFRDIPWRREQICYSKRRFTCRGC